MTAIQFRDVTLALGGRAVLSRVSLDIGAGEFVAVLGPNGAGKTTFLRAVLGLARPSSGRIAVLGTPATAGNAAIGYMPQGRAGQNATRLSGRDIVASGWSGRRLGLPLLGREGAREVDRALERVGATALARRPLAELSGGERQRVLLAQALLGRPKLLLLDEPLASLDPTHQRAVVDLVQSLALEQGLSVVFTAHDLNPLLGVMHRVLYLGGGLAAIGTVDEVVTGPVLSRLYGSDVEVVRLQGRIFVMSGHHPASAHAHHA